MVIGKDSIVFELTISGEFVLNGEMMVFMMSKLSIIIEVQL